MTEEVEKTTEELVAEYLAKGGKVTEAKKTKKTKKKEDTGSWMNEYSSR